MKDKRSFWVGLWIVAALLLSFSGEAISEKGTADLGSGISRNLLSGDSSFETGRGNSLMTGSTQNNVEINLDPDHGLDGRQSLKIQGGYSLLPAWGEAVPTEIGKRYTFSLYARSDKDGVSGGIQLRVGTGWSARKFDKKIRLSKEWKRYSVTITAKEREYHPCFYVNGIAWVDAVQFEQGDKATPYKNKAPIIIGSHISQGEASYVFLQDEKLSVEINIYKVWHEAKTKDLSFSFQITNLFEDIVKKGEEKVVLDKDGRFKKRFIFPCERLGLFTIRAQVKEKEDIINKASYTAFAVVKPPVEIEKGMEPFCGTCDREIGRIPALKRIGVRWMESAVYWNEIEREKGKILWPDARPFRQKKEGFKVKMLILGHQAPEWAHNKEGIEKEMKKFPGYRWNYDLLTIDMSAWRNFIRQLVIHYKDVVDIYELGGELDLIGLDPYYRKKYPESIKGGLAIPEPIIKRLAQMIKIGNEEIKKVVPNAIVGPMRPTGYGYRTGGMLFSTEVFKEAGKDFNIFPRDHYVMPHKIGTGQPPEGSPEEYFEVFRQALEIGKKYGCNQHVYISEGGAWKLDTRTAPDSSFARKQAANTAKTFLISRMTEGVDYCMIFTAGKDSRGTRNYNWGLFRNPYPLPGIPAYSAVARIVENTVESRQIKVSPEIRAGVFRKSNHADAAIWGINPKNKMKVSILANPESVFISDIVGNPLSTKIKDYKGKKKKITFALGEYPVYLSKKGRRAFSQISQILSESKIDITPVSISFFTPEITKGIVHLRNKTYQNLSCEVSLHLPGYKPLTKKADVPGRKKASIEFDLPIKLIRKDEVRIEVSCEGFEKVTGSFPLVEFESCKRVTFSPKVDGDISEWSKHPYFSMNEKGQIMPQDVPISWTGREDLSAKVYTGWDEDNLYFAAEVTDDKHFNVKKGADIWNGDGFQIAFDTLSDAFAVSMAEPSRGYDANDYEFGIALLKDGPCFYQWNGTGNVRKVKKLSIVRKGDKTFYEMSIPFSALGPSYWKKDKVFGFSFVIFDDDEGGGQGYHYQLTPGITYGKDPRNFKKFVLDE